MNLYLVGGVLTSLLARRVTSHIRTTSRAVDPAAHVAASLGDIVEESHAAQPSDWTPDDCAHHLEDAANVLEHHLAPSLDDFDNDSATHEWLTRELQRRAAGLRMLKRQLYLPGEVDLEAVARQCGELVVIALDGLWAEFPVSDPPSSRTGRRRLAGVLDAARTLVVSIIPLGVVAVADRFSSSFTGSAARWAWVITVGWAVVGLLVLVDPHVGERLEITHRVLTRLPGIGAQTTDRAGDQRSG